MLQGSNTIKQDMFIDLVDLAVELRSNSHRKVYKVNENNKIYLYHDTSNSVDINISI